MREILYKYHNRGMYETEDNTCFAGEIQVKIIAEPHDFSLKIGEDVLRSTAFGGCMAVVSDAGEVVFYDNKDNELGRAERSEESYEEVRFEWKENTVIIQFGRTVLVDNYPNCDGEYDRWDKRFKVGRTVTLNLANNLVEIK